MRAAVAVVLLALGLAGCDAAPSEEPIPIPPAPVEEPPRPEPDPPVAESQPERTYIWDTGPRWLADRQNVDGSWGRDGDLGLTGLVVLAYLSCGATDNSGASKDTVKGALRHLVGAQREDGSFADIDAPLGFSTHAVGTLALTEAHGLTGRKFLRESAQRGIDVLLAARTTEGGFEGPSSIWAVIALKSAQLGGLDVSPDAVRRAAASLGSQFDVTTGRTRMRVGAQSASVAWLHGDGLVAGAILARVYAGESPRESAELRAGARRLLDGARAESRDDGVDPGDAYMMTIALWQMPNELWVPWVKRLHQLVPQDEPLPLDDGGDNAIRDVALRVMTWRGTQGYRRVFPDSGR